MNWTRWLLLLPIAALVLPAVQSGEKKKEVKTPPRKIVSLDPRFDKLLPKDAKVETIARGFIWTEGPVWVKDGGFLLFSDIPNNAVNQWQEGKGVSKYLHPSGYTGAKPRGGKPGDEPGSNGLLLDAQGRLTLCEHGDRRVSRVEKDGKKTTLADKYMGKRLNSPNDLVYHSNGDLYFTDPPYGLPKGAEDPTRELDFCGVYLRKKGGKLILLTKEMTRPNGIALSPDEKTLYVANSDPEQPIWNSFAVKEDGTIGEGKIFVDGMKWVKGKRPGLPDGMKVDVQGNLWATGPGGVWVFSPDGAVLGNIDTGTNTANVAFGNDGTMLYIAANHDICRVRTTTKGKGF